MSFLNAWSKGIDRQEGRSGSFLLRAGNHRLSPGAPTEQGSSLAGEDCMNGLRLEVSLIQPPLQLNALNADRSPNRSAVGS